MTICYNKDDAVAAFGGLADELERIAGLDFSAPLIVKGKYNIKVIDNLTSADPQAAPIREPFDTALKTARIAGDAETEKALQERRGILEAMREKIGRNEETFAAYSATLRGIAAWVRGLLADIAEDGTKRTDTATHGEIKSNGQQKPKLTKKRGRPLTQNELKSNARRNELITEIRRRAKANFTRGAEGIAAAYDEIDAESKQAGSKWQKIIALTPRGTIIDKARHNKKYVTTQ